MKRSSRSVSRFQSSFLALALVVSATAAVPASAVNPPAATSGSYSGVSQSSGTLARIWLDTPRALNLRYSGKGDAVAALSSGNAKALSLAQGDFDEDGVTDLAVGYATASGGAIAIHRGNLDARAPQTHRSFLAVGQGQFADPFLPQVQAVDVAIHPDFIAVGDFDGDGHADILIGSRKSSTVLALLGDGKGNFPRTLQLNLSGTVTALSAQRIDRSSVGDVLLAGVRGVNGAPPALVAFTATQDGIAQLFALSMRAPVTAFAFGNLDHDSFVDTALIAGGQIFILHGSDVHAAVAHGGTVPIEALSLGVNAVSVEIGKFISDRDPRQQLAVMGSDGSVSIVTHSNLDAKPWSSAELKSLHHASLHGHQNVLSPDQLSESWTIAESFGGLTAGSALMLRTRISGSGPDDIVVADSQTGQLHQLSHASVRNQQELVGGLPASTHLSMHLGNGQAPALMLSMHVNIDARPGLVTINAGQVTPHVLMTLPDPTYFVNRTDDPAPTSPIANACNNTSASDTSSSCSLREAVIKANGDTIMVKAGTYTLTRPAVVEDFTGQHGALDVLHGVTIIGEVDGSGHPASIIQAGTSSSNGIDKVFSIDPNFDTAFDTQLTNLVIQYGRNTQSYFDAAGAGGAIEWEAKDTGTLHITNCVIQNNSTTDGDGGGIAADNESGGSGALTITGSTIQNNSVAESSTGGSGIGGGILVGYNTPMTVTNSSILNNHATQTNTPGGQGGGVYIFDPGSALVAFHGSTIGGNAAASHGGGIYAGGAITIDQSSVISNNTAGGNGGGLWFNGLSETATISKTTFVGNIATGTGGAIQVDTSGALNISYSRLAGNTATLGSNLYNAGATVTATNNWWGTNTVANTVHTAAGTTAYIPYVALTHVASPNKIRINQSATLTADLSKNSVGTALTGNLDVFQGLSVTFGSPVLGTIPQAQPETLNASAQNTATFNAGGIGGDGSAMLSLDQATVTAPVTVLQPPSISTSFSPATMLVNAHSTLTFSIANGNTVAINGSFTDTLPAGLVVATTPNVVNGCGGSVTATAGSSAISFPNAALATGTCTLKVDAQASTDGVFNNSVTINSTDAGNGNTSAASLTAINPPTIAAAFGATTVPLNGTTSLTFTLTSSNANSTLAGLAFADALPSGLTVASPNNLNSTCSGTATGLAGSSSVSLSGGSLAAGASCVVSVNVTGTSTGVKNNSVQVSSTNGGTGNTASASIMVVAPAVIIKAFGASSIPLNGSTSLTFTIQNNNTTQNLSSVAFNDTFPAGLTVSTPNGFTGSCGGGTITSTQGPNAVTLSGAALAASTSCTFSVNVTGTTAGQKNNTTGAVTSTEGGTGGTASASLNVEAPLSIAAAFTPATIPVNGTSALSIALTNPAANAAAETAAAFSNTLPSGLVVATPNGLTNTCGGTATAVAGSGTFSLAGASIATNSSCTFIVNVTGVSGQYTNTTGSVTSTNGGTGNTATANLTVVTPPAITKAFGAASIPLNGTTSLTFTLQNPNTGAALTGLAFADSFPAGTVVATPSALTSTCGGTTTAIAGTNSASLTAGTLAASASCTVSINVTGTSAGVKNNSVQITSTEGGTGNTSNASITVTAPAVIIKAFGATSVPLNGSTSLTFTIQNNNATQSLSSVTFTDTFPAGLTVSTPNGLTGSCGGGTITSTQTTNVVSLSGASLAASTSCTFSVNVTGTTSGQKNNTTGAVTSSEGGNGGTASASLSVVAPPAIAKAFSPATVALNGTSTLTFTVTNPATNTVAESGVAFTDTLPTGLVVATPNGLSNTCGGTVTAMAGSGSLSLSGGSTAVNSSCTIVVNVTGTASGQYTNTTGSVTSTNGGTGNTATANLTIATPPSITKAFGAAMIPLNGTTSLTFTLQNPNPGVSLTNVAFTDSFPAGITVATPSALTSTCGGTSTATAGSGSASLAGATLAANASCTVSINITGTSAGVKNNSVQVTSTEGGTGNTSNASITVVAPTVIIKAFGASSIPLNGSTSLTFTIQNNNTTQSLSSVAFNDTFPAGLTVSTPNGLTGSCGGGTITSTQGTNAVTLSGAALAASTSCTFSVNVTGTTAGQKNNTTGAVTSTEGGTGGTASASLTVEAPLSIAAAFSPTTIPVNGTSALTFTLTNPAANTTAETGAAFSDVFPAGLVVATPSGLTNSCGGTATAVAGSGSLSLTGASVATSSSCTVTVDVTGTSGQYTNTTGSVTSTNGGTGNTASATLTVASAPTVAIGFGTASVPVGGSTSLTFQIANPNSGLAMTGIALTDNLPAGLTVSSPSGFTGNCTGSINAVASSTSIAIVGATLSASGTCAFSVNVTAFTPGVQADTTGPISSNESGPGASSNTAVLTVLGPPAISAAFGSSSIQLTGSTSLTFTITNPNSSLALNGLAFTATLPSALVVSTPSGLANSCGGVASVSGGTISLSGGATAASSACVVSLNVTSTSAGSLTETTSAVTSSNGGTGNSASAQLTVLAPDLTIAVSNAGSFRQGDASDSYTITVSNTGNSVSNGAVSFTDTLPSGLTAKTIAGAGWTCTLATLTCTRADSLAASASFPAVTLTVSVANNAASQVTNSATVIGGGEVVTSNDTGSDATTVIQAADFTVSSSHIGSWVQEQTGDIYTLTVNNIGPGPTVGTVTVVDTLPSAFTATAISGAGWNCTLGTLTCTRSDVLANGSSYPVISLTVSVSATAASPQVNAVAVSGGGELNTTNDSATDSTTLVAPTVTITNNTPLVTIKAGQTAAIPLTVAASVNLSGTLALSCQTSAPHVTCSIAPNPVPLTTGGTTVQVQIQTAGSNKGTVTESVKRVMVPALAFLFGLPTMVLAAPVRRKRMARTLALMLGLLLLMIGMSGCGSPATTPAGSFTLTVSGSVTTPSGAISVVAPISFVVTSH